MSSKLTFSSGGQTAVHVFPAKANNQTEWRNGSINTAQYAESFKCVYVCGGGGLVFLFIHEYSDSE